MMNKKTIMTMLVDGALSVSALSTTAVFAEDAVVNENTPAVTETTTSTYQPEYKQLTDTWTGNNDIVFEVDGKGGFFYVDSIEPFNSNGDGSTYINSTIQPKVELDANGKGKITFSSDAIKKAKYYYHAEEVNQLDWTKVDTIAISMGFRKGTYITGETFYVPIKLDASETTKPSATLKSNAFTGDNDIVLDVNTTDGKVVFGQVELCSSDYTYINTLSLRKMLLLDHQIQLKTRFFILLEKLNMYTFKRKEIASVILRRIVDTKGFNNEMVRATPIPILLKKAYYEYLYGIFDE